MPDLSNLDKTIVQLEEQSELLKKNNNTLVKVKELSVEIEKSAKELSGANKNLEEFIGYSKKYFKDFEESINSKLERFNSDTQVTIRQERTQLQEALQNNILLQFNNMQTKQTELFAAQSKRISLLTILLSVVVIICIALSIKIYF